MEQREIAITVLGLAATYLLPWPGASAPAGMSEPVMYAVQAPEFVGIVLPPSGPVRPCAGEDDLASRIRVELPRGTPR